ncbi:ABC transporter ATP-binding protein [Flavobacterium dauae]|uniref:ABC transporter ATP-binding protein n=1 Tax=Flavobacterium dauae TaxID=1563479 RepID=UPI00101B28E1|nr:ABC transporter ATP-binding protein [Flavobacterium dauae]WLD24358.1 ABC transporter ATP-binding protein [Flavobacterium dauae]
MSFSYHTTPVLTDVNFQLAAGRSYALIGASGSGKSTLLKLMYGLLDANFGTVFWNDEPVLGPAYHLVPGMSFMKYLAQDFDLMPFVSVEENVGRFLSNFYLKEKKERINELLTLVGMTDFSHIKAKFLSGGQMQRTALAKVLALEPQVLLLDEPFSHIDYHQKTELAQHVFAYCKEKGITVIYTSHTPDEILMFSDEVIVMKNGVVIEKNTPQNIYQNPKNEYIARLTGEVNVIPSNYLNNENDLLLRPHQLKVVDTGYEAEVLQSYYVGKNYFLKVAFQDLLLMIESDKSYSGKIKFEITKL